LRQFWAARGDLTLAEGGEGDGATPRPGRFSVTKITWRFGIADGQGVLVPGMADANVGEDR
jgi:hypothetical protein